MSFEFDSTKSLSNFNDVLKCLKAWSGKIPNLFCKNKGHTLTILRIDNPSPKVIATIKNVSAVHIFKEIRTPATKLKQYKLTVKGKDNKDKTISFHAHLEYETKEEQSDSISLIAMSFIWKENNPKD